MAVPVYERLMRRVSVEPNGCWLWNGSLREEGYGQIVGELIDGRRKMHHTHRLSFEVHRGPIPKGMHLDHLCHGWDESCRGGKTCVHRRCVNPDHLQPVLPEENIRRGRGNGSKTHCRNGHPYDRENTITEGGGGRRCRTCRREQSRARYANNPEYRENMKAYVREWKKANRGYTLTKSATR